MSTPIKIILADDHKVVLEGFMTMFIRHDDFKVVGTAADGKTLVEKVITEQPDVVITDVTMPGMDGIEATRIILKKFPKIAVIGTSAFNYSQMIMDMLSAGARGFVSKASDTEILYEAVRETHAGRTYYSPDIRKMIADLVAQGQFDPRNRQPIAFSPMHIRIIQCICKEMGPQQIADELLISLSTFKRFRTEILDTIDVKSNESLIKYAINNGIFRG